MARCPWARSELVALRSSVTPTEMPAATSGGRRSATTAVDAPDGNCSRKLAAPARPPSRKGSAACAEVSITSATAERSDSASSTLAGSCSPPANAFTVVGPRTPAGAASTSEISSWDQDRTARTSYPGLAGVAATASVRPEVACRVITQITADSRPGLIGDQPGTAVTRTLSR